MEGLTFLAILIPLIVLIILVWLYAVVAEMRAETQGGGCASLRTECLDWKFHVIVICYPFYIPVAFCFKCCGLERWLSEHLDWYYCGYLCSYPCRKCTGRGKSDKAELPMYTSDQPQQPSEDPYPVIERPSPAAVFPSNR
ncbi:hypothetical protein BJV82DRAFT_672184 [Fennellomyces sp. T-0311]|nr:hypothetical protein BJV82DRAFT_672184 [Fennellomyces sp. T-0311]